MSPHDWIYKVFLCPNNAKLVGCGMGMGFAPTWLRQVSLPLLHMTTLITAWYSASSWVVTSEAVCIRLNTIPALDRRGEGKTDGRISHNNIAPCMRCRLSRDKNTSESVQTTQCLAFSKYTSPAPQSRRSRVYQLDSECLPFVSVEQARMFRLSAFAHQSYTLCATRKVINSHWRIRVESAEIE